MEDPANDDRLQIITATEKELRVKSAEFRPIKVGHGYFGKPSKSKPEPKLATHIPLPGLKKPLPSIKRKPDNASRRISRDLKASKVGTLPPINRKFLSSITKKKVV